MRILERNPRLVNEDFARRLVLAAEASEDEAEAHLLRESSELVARAVAAGVEEAFREKLGLGGLIAGRARETRGRYYKTRDPKILGEAVDQFVEALGCDDDPLEFDQGGTLQGFGATLLDFAHLVPDPIVSHVGCLAFLAAATAHLAADTPLAEDSWLERLADLISGMRNHLDLAEASAPETAGSELHRSVRRACEQVETGLGEATGGFWGRLEASLPILAVAFACPRVDLPVPEIKTRRDPRLQEAAEAWRKMVFTWIGRYGSDCFRALIATPLGNPLEPEATGLRPGRRLDQPSLDEVFTDAEPDVSLLEAPVTPGRGALALLMLAVLSAVRAPKEAQESLERAEALLDEAPSSPRNACSPFHARAFLTTLAAGVGAFLKEGSALDRFSAVRQAWSMSWLEEMLASVEAELSGAPAPAGAPPLGTEAAIQAATCVRDPVARLAATGNDLGLPDAPRYRRLLDGLNDLLFGGNPGAGGFVVDEDTPGLTEKGELLARFQADPSSLQEAERNDLCDWLGAAYEARRVSFFDADAELTLLVNLGCLCLRSRREDTLKWSDWARRLALEEGALMDAATADINISSFYLEALRRQPAWSLDVDEAGARLLALLGALSHALEALRIATSRLRFADPEDRFHVGSIGYGEIRLVIEEALFEAKDASLLTEYLLNARGMWFLLDLYEAASGIDARPHRPAVSWRNRSWVAQSVAVDQDLALGHLGSAAEVDVAEILSPDGEPRALWFATMLESDRERVASSLLAPPNAFVATFEAYPATLREPGACLDVAEALGALLPHPLWSLAEALHDQGGRSALFVSADPGLPPIAMGMWRNPRQGAVSVLADAFDIVYCPTLAPRRSSIPWIEEGRPAAPAAFVVCDPLGDLPGGRAVPELAQLVLGNAGHGTRPPANRETVSALIDASALADGVFVYQGHSHSGGIDEPGAASLLLEPVGPSTAVAEPLLLRELLAGVRDSSSGRMPRRAAFLSCLSGASAAPYDATGLAMGALAAGSEAVVSTLQPIPDSGGWGPAVDQMVEVLRAPRPWEAFGRWQRDAARDLEEVNSEDVRWALSSLTMFGAPHGKGAGTVAADG
jgi:CHAT domain-containing protein